MTFNKKIDARWITKCAMLLAIELAILLLPFLQIELGAFTIVFTALPIALAAILLDVRATTFLGIVWGVVSFCQSFSDTFGLIMIQSNIVGTIIVLGLSRVMVGVLTSLIYWLLSKVNPLRYINVGITCFLASVFNNLFFMGGLALFFKDTFMEIIYPILGVSIVFNMIPETIVCVLLGTPIVIALRKAKLEG